MNRWKALITALVTTMITVFLCAGLYSWDNKYTRDDSQPISGVLYLPENTERCYLIRQWLLYPDVLLTPDTADQYSGYRTYTDIGGERDIPANESTYRLTLLLPETPAEYALELPEIFSACRLYVNGEQLLTLGDPSPDHFREGMRQQLVTFSAAGKTDLLLAVSDHSGVNQGLTYPPAFGTLQALLSARETRLLLHGSLVLIALLGALLSFSFCIKGERLKGICAVLLCLSLAVTTGYPLYHGLLTTRVQPWYTLEPAAYYALMLFALLLQSTLYELDPKPRFGLILPSLLGLVCTVIRFAGASILPAAFAEIFDWLSTGLKYYTAFGILLLSAWALWKEKLHSTLLLCGSLAFSVCLLWDRLFPMYEPIYGGWYGEIGGSLLVLSLGAALWLDAMDAYRFRLTYEASFHQMEQRLVLQKEHYSQLSWQIQLTREASHDLRHHIRMIRSLADQDHYDRLLQYLNEFDSHVQDRDLTIRSEHPVADAVLSYYAKSAAGLNASYDARLTIPPDLSLPDDELCILLSNLLENAIEALAKQTEGSRRIYLRGEAQDKKLKLLVDNTYQGERQIKNGIYLSTKHPGPGLGLQSVHTIVNKYHGLADFEAKDGIFHASVMIPLKE